MIPTLYRGSVKDLLGPAKTQTVDAVVFEYSDAFSVFDWGRMPDFIPKKGQSLAVLTADLFEKMERPETWREFSRSPFALALRKGNRFGGIFNEIGEELQTQGLRTHYLGVLDFTPNQIDVVPKKTSQVKEPFRRLVVRQVSVVRPTMTTVLGRILPDYGPTRNSVLPRLVPLEVVFRFSCPEGSSLFSRVEKDPHYLTTLGFPEAKLLPQMKWDFPILELFTKLESTDRPVFLSEALAISGLSAKQLQEILLKTAWVAGLLQFYCSKTGIELADGKLEWALGEDGRCFLADAIGPDELRLLKNGVQISKEFLRTYFRQTPWYASIEKAKLHAKKIGITDWKRFIQEPVPTLPSAYRELASQMYLALTNGLTQRQWFANAWTMDRVIEGISQIK